jgi:uncharacterized protein YecA (UPF0149 family)
VKKYIDEGYYDRGMLSLEESLYATCVITGNELPEMEQWKKEIEREHSRTTSRQIPTMINTQPYVREVKVDRNDPCPCGSGKKYKKCCGK